MNISPHYGLEVLGFIGFRVCVGIMFEYSRLLIHVSIPSASAMVRRWEEENKLPQASLTLSPIWV